MNERRRDLVVVLGGASLLLALDFLLPHACTEKSGGTGAVTPPTVDGAEETPIG